MANYYTRHDSQDQATATYVALATATDGTAVSAIKAASNETAITAIFGAVSVDGAATVSVGNVFAVKLGGKAIPQGDQEIILGAISSQETGTSVGETISINMAFYQKCNIPIVPGNEITLAGAYAGTDIGTTFMSVTIEVS